MHHLGQLRRGRARLALAHAERGRFRGDGHGHQDRRGGHGRVQQLLRLPRRPRPLLANQTAGVPFNIKVTAQDASNNTVTSFNGTVDVSSNRTCSAGCTASANFTGGVLSSHSITLSGAGTGSTISVIQSGGSASGVSNSFTVFSPDGAGTMIASPTYVANGAGGKTLTFTYTVPAGGMSGGALSLTVPDGWSQPSTTATDPGYSTSSYGTLAVADRTMTVSGLNRAAGSSVQIVYGVKRSGGPGATAPTTAGAQSWPAKSMITGSGSLQPLASSPSVTVLSPDGSGTMSPSPSSVSQGSSGNTLIFTYTAASGGMVNGTLTLAVPSGWSAPSTLSSDPGYSTASQGTLTLSGRKILVSGVTLAGGASMTVTYGSGSGATAPTSPGPQTWSATERSSNQAGAQTALASSPVVTVTP